MKSIIHRRASEGHVLQGLGLTMNWFAIITSGVVKLTKPGTNGRSQIVGLKFSGDLIGRPLNLDASVSFEAATDLTFCTIPEASFRELATAFPEIERAVMGRVFQELERIREWVLLLGRSNAQARVANLITYIASEASSGSDVTSFELPLSREEIASCLGLRTETVCRQLAHFKEKGIIRIKRARTVEIVDQAALLLMGGGTGSSEQTCF